MHQGLERNIKINKDEAERHQNVKAAIAILTRILLMRGPFGYRNTASSR